ncbi:hypothetical protein QYF61_003954 [Mycteria americana]|uniref:Uncharacterized protein n=1 Tax=Mycteria americana TaxID=33587 RepID=A0AAN7RPK1_MYCAM|nr:hypothetical protein QYF61_003954 [Mycteria americana]
MMSQGGHSPSSLKGHGDWRNRLMTGSSQLLHAPFKNAQVMSRGTKGSAPERVPLEPVSGCLKEKGKCPKEKAWRITPWDRDSFFWDLLTTPACRACASQYSCSSASWEQPVALTTTVDSSLHSPMDFFLRNLSFLEICYPSVTAKKAGGFPDGRWQDLLPRLCCPAVCPGFVGQDQMLLLAALAYHCYIAKCDCCVKRATVTLGKRWELCRRTNSPLPAAHGEAQRLMAVGGARALEDMWP